MLDDVFEKVMNGEVTSTCEFQVSSIRRGTDDGKKWQIYLSLLELIYDGYIEGEKDESGTQGENYKNLKPTKSGIEYNDFMNTPVNKLGKTTVAETCRNGILSTFVGNITWWLVAAIVLIIVPTINEDAKAILKNVVEYFLSLLS